MSSLEIRPSLPTVKFPVEGAKVRGVIVDFQDVQERDFNTKQPKTWQDGNPVMQTRVTLALPDQSHVNLYVGGKLMKNAVRSAFKEAGVTDFAKGDELEMEFTTWVSTDKGRAKDYSAQYTVFGPDAS